MPCYDRTRENEDHQKRRVSLIRKNFNHQEIDAIFENEIYDNMSWKQLKEAQRELDKQKEEFELEKKAHETKIQETKTELEDLETQIKVKKAIIDETNLETSLRKLNYFMKKAQEDFKDNTLVVFLYLGENDKWTSKYFPIEKKQQTVVLEVCEALRKEAVSK